MLRGCFVEGIKPLRLPTRAKSAAHDRLLYNTPEISENREESKKNLIVITLEIRSMWQIWNFLTFSFSRINEGLVIQVLISFVYECFSCKSFGGVFRLADAKTGAQRI